MHNTSFSLSQGINHFLPPFFALPRFFEPDFFAGFFADDFFLLAAFFLHASALLRPVLLLPRSCSRSPGGLTADPRDEDAAAARALLEGGAQPRAPTANGKSALDIARLNRRAAIVELFEAGT